ncbi:MAG: uroporphyrinogen-III synthase [Rhizobiaceae bacterium]|nr:uroporphyrinogen-III synthase [Rhizobiaceae bacterium]
MSSASGRRVLVTRPEPGASETVRRLEDMGFSPVTMPLQETRTLPVQHGAIRNDVAAVAVPSASAIRHAPGHLLQAWTGLPCFAVGAATANIAKGAGFSHVLAAEGDAASLADMVIRSRPAGSVAYICGRVRRPVFEERLAAAGIPVGIVETYDTLPLGPDAETVESVLGAGAVDYALVFSANAATLLVDLIGQSEDMFRDAVFLCISARVAGAFADKGRKTIVALEPSEAALLDTLRETAGRAS